LAFAFQSSYKLLDFRVAALWFGEITEFEQYRDLVDWATRSKDAGELLPLPKEFQ
jgi:hypothetical protein